MKTTCAQCEYFKTNGCKNVSGGDGACAAFKQAENK